MKPRTLSTIGACAVWWSKNRARKKTIDLIKNNPKLAAERNEEFYGFWSDTISDFDELKRRRDAYPGQEPKLSHAFQIDAAELGELPQGIKLDIGYSESPTKEPSAEARWWASKQGFLLTALLESLHSPKWLLPRIEEWLSAHIDDLSAMIDHEADMYLTRKLSEFQLAIFLNAIHAAASFHCAYEMSRWFIRRHARKLAIRRSQLISKDSYGVGDSAKWQREKTYFFSKVMLPTLGFADDENERRTLKESTLAAFDAWIDDDMPIDLWIPADYKDSFRLWNLFNDVLDGRPHGVLYSWRELFPVECRHLVITEMTSPRLGDLVSDWIEREVAAFGSPRTSEESPVQSFTGHEYEEYCIKILRDGGWEARQTPKSGDQGVDIIAERDGISVAIQCKNYRQPVGNKAVQEVLAGKSYEHADFAAVVSPAPYTKAARDLASATGVLLLHHEELRDFGKLARTP